MNFTCLSMGFAFHRQTVCRCCLKRVISHYFEHLILENNHRIFLLFLKRNISCSAFADQAFMRLLIASMKLSYVHPVSWNVHTWNRNEFCHNSFIQKNSFILFCKKRGRCCLKDMGMKVNMMLWENMLCILEIDVLQLGSQGFNSCSLPALSLTFPLS